MEMTRIGRDNVTTIVYSILTRKGLAVKYKVKLHTKDKNQDEQYYYQEFLLPKDQICVNLSPRPYIEWVLSHPNSDGAKVVIYVTEVYKARIVRKLRKIANAFEAYDDNEVDFIVVDQTGTHIHTEIAKPIIITVGVQTLTFTPVIVPENCKVGMMISSEGANAILSVKDFLMLYYRLDELNFMHMTTQLITYLLNMPIGTNRTDFRRDKVNPSLENLAIYEPSAYNKISVMGNLIDIENPTGIIRFDPNSKKPKW